MIAFTLVVVGALNWGLVALNFNLVEWLTMENVTLMRVIYALVGLSAVWILFTHKKDCRACTP